MHRHVLYFASTFKKTFIIPANYSLAFQDDNVDSPDGSAELVETGREVNVCIELNYHQLQFVFQQYKNRSIIFLNISNPIPTNNYHHLQASQDSSGPSLLKRKMDPESGKTAVESSIVVGDTNIVGEMSVGHDVVPAYSGEIIGSVVVSTEWKMPKKVINYF